MHGVIHTACAVSCILLNLTNNGTLLSPLNQTSRVISMSPEVQDCKRELTRGCLAKYYGIWTFGVLPKLKTYLKLTERLQHSGVSSMTDTVQQRHVPSVASLKAKPRAFIKTPWRRCTEAALKWHSLALISVLCVHAQLVAITHVP